MRPRLASDSLPVLAGRATLPGYDRQSIGVGQLHLGLGAFHRAHQAVYTEDVLEQSGGDWGICGVSLRKPTVRDRLAPQDLLYSITERDGDQLEHRVIGSLRECLVAPEDPRAVIARLAHPAVHVVTLTITEKGYCLDSTGETLDFDNPAIAADRLTAPHSAIGYLVAGLDARRDAGAGGLTLLSCDNLSSNGGKLRAAVLSLAESLAPDSVSWIADHCRFPSSMVDRIVPSATDADRKTVAAALGIQDAAALVTEPFCQWVIEADFAGPVPAWNTAGARYVKDVAPFEAMKLRLLNASHSTVAYLGCLAGFDTVAEAVAAPGMTALLNQLMEKEMGPTLSGLGDYDLDGYRESLLRRFANRGLAHRCAQIAMDGSEKIPQRLLPGLRAQLQTGGTIDATCLALAAWLRFLAGRDDSGRTLSLDDPRADDLKALSAAHRGEPGALVESVLMRFDPELAANPRLRSTTAHWMEVLAREGAAATVAGSDWSWSG